MLPYGATGGLETPPTAPALGSIRSHTRTPDNRRSVGVKWRSADIPLVIRTLWYKFRNHLLKMAETVS